MIFFNIFVATMGLQDYFVTPSALRAPLRVLCHTEHCAPLAWHSMAFSQPSKDLAVKLFAKRA